MTTFVRPPAVAGQFYPSEAAILLRDIQSYMPATAGKARILGCIAPHAGYMYSGHVAGAVYARIALPRRFIVLCPNHTGLGEPLAIISSGAFRTPLGDAPIDAKMATALKTEFPALAEDGSSQAREHGLEVQLPFLQAMIPDFSFVPITVGSIQYQYLEQLGMAIASIIQQQAEPMLIIASSDMNHYEADSATRVKDRKAIEKILSLDPLALHQVVKNERISMCGIGPAVAMLTATKLLGATKAELVKYATSGDVSGDRNRVVGYAGMLIS